MTLLKISVPVFKKDKWKNLEKDGKIEVSSDVDNLSEGYQSLKIEIDKLLSELNAENRLAEQAHALEREIERKAFELEGLNKNIEKATEHYEDFKIFLERLGIDPTAPRLTFDKRFLLRDASLSQIESVSSSEF
jgi:predicted RNase H-like nuclease (RuvC/YqgF family)